MDDELKAARRICLHKKVIDALRRAGFGHLVAEYVERSKIDMEGRPL